MEPLTPEIERRLERLRRATRGRSAQIESVGPGEESVWDYPRPPRVEACTRRLRVEFAGVVIADSTRALRVLETASPPTLYVPPEDVETGRLEAAQGTSWCEWKGQARYWDVCVGGARATQAAWSYPSPFESYAALAGHLAFFPGRVDACWLDDEAVRPQEGDYYGGWVTREIKGPMKGAPGTRGW
jgi:uncharacterized protein (DUF427 family)